MRFTLAVLLVTALVLPAASAGSLSPVFGVSGAPRFDAYTIPEDLPSAHEAAEPTLGISPTTRQVYFQAFANTYQTTFDDATLPPTPTWRNVSPAFTPINVDPMLHVDEQTGRIFAGGLIGPCSLMGISDDEGATWTPTGNMCSGAQFDHQSVGSGPWSTTSPDSAARALVYPRATYYCAQLQLTACATSVDGGRVFLPFTEVTGGCGGLHGHISVSEATGFAAVPHGGCAGPEANTPLDGGNLVGFAYTDNNGATWQSRVMPQAQDGNGFDPDLAFSRESGWLWLAQADEAGIHIALSKDQGQNWEQLGAATPSGATSTWFDLGPTFTDPDTGDALVYGAFPDLEAGDDARAALAFLGTTNPAGEEPFTDCSEVSDGNVWHYYLSQTFDGGATWTTTRLSEDPVQIGAIWNGGGGDPCRNLLDFHDMDMDNQGRLHIALSDGCTKACAEQYAAWKEGNAQKPVGADSRDSWGTILRQTTGLGLLSEFDGQSVPGTPVGDEPGAASGRGTPLPVGLALLALAGLALRRRSL